VEVISLGYRTDLALRESGGSEIEDRGDHLVIRSPHNPTHWWGNFLLLADVPRPGIAPAWLSRFAAEFPGAEHVAIGFDVTNGAAGDLDWFTERGFAAEFLAVMTATDVSEPPRSSPGSACRCLGSDDDWAQSVELGMRCKEESYEGAAHRRYLTAKMQTQRRLVEAGRGRWFGAFVAGQLVAQMGLFSAGGGLARFQTVETDPAFRRRGLARSLLYHAGRYGLDELGAERLVIVADPGYFAMELYRGTGFVATETQLQIERQPAAR